MPGTPADAKGLLKAAIRDNDPVVFIEGEKLYAMQDEVPDGVVTEWTPASDGVALRVQPAASSAVPALLPPSPPPPRVNASASPATTTIAIPPIAAYRRFRRSDPGTGGFGFPCERGFGGMDGQG